MRDFVKKYKVDLIEIPEEFKDLEVSDDFRPLKKGGRSVQKRKFVRSKSDKTTRDYEVWRSYDRRGLQIQPNDQGCCKLMLPPALMKRAFGKPVESEMGFAVSGIYDFEDSNLDVYRIFDYKKT